MSIRLPLSCNSFETSGRRNRLGATLGISGARRRKTPGPVPHQGSHWCDYRRDRGKVASKRMRNERQATLRTALDGFQIEFYMRCILMYPPASACSESEEGR